MGIQGLLRLLKSIVVPVHIKDLKGCCVAVDTYSWLHKGALSCSKDLCKGQPTTKHIDYCMNRVNLLWHYGVKPILVFDGGLLPMKSEQENKRARARKENLARAIERESNRISAAAYDCYQKAVDISPSIAYELIQVLKQENIFYVVAPYEADAQMTLLAVSKQVDAVMTEDSDLIAFGCPRVFGEEENNAVVVKSPISSTGEMVSRIRDKPVDLIKRSKMEVFLFSTGPDMEQSSLFFVHSLNEGQVSLNLSPFEIVGHSSETGWVLLVSQFSVLLFDGSCRTILLPDLPHHLPPVEGDNLTLGCFIMNGETTSVLIVRFEGAQYLVFRHTTNLGEDFWHLNIVLEHSEPQGFHHTDLNVLWVDTNNRNLTVIQNWQNHADFQ